MSAPIADLSRWNGTLDWPRFAPSVAAVYLKATEHTTWVDPTFAANRREAQWAGLRHGAYHFFRANRDGLAQARHFYLTAGGAPGGLPPAIDVEEADGVPASLLTVRLRDCLLETETLFGVRPVIYTRASFWNTATTRPTWIGDYRLWLAHYSTAITAPALPAGASDWWLWQWTSTGRLPGCVTNVDLNRLNRTLDESPANSIRAHTAAIRAAAARVGELL